MPGVQLQLQSIDEQRAQLQGEQDKLVLAEQRLSAKVESFRTRKETIKAQYTAAEAQAKIGEAFSGVSEEMADVGMAIERAEIVNASEKHMPSSAPWPLSLGKTASTIRTEPQA